MSGLTVKIFINDKRGGRIATLAEVVRSNKKNVLGAAVSARRERDQAKA